jgi:hypothetical protein
MIWRVVNVMLRALQSIYDLVGVIISSFTEHMDPKGESIEQVMMMGKDSRKEKIPDND